MNKSFVIPVQFIPYRRARRRTASTFITLGAVAALVSPATAAWAATAGPAPASTIAGALSGISCASTKYCFAVGYHSPTASKPSALLAEKWNGTKWAAVSTPAPSGSNGARFYEVACVSTKNCLAVGSSFTASRTTLPLAEQWNGTAWSIVTVPAPAGATQTVLEGITCVNATDCWADGLTGSGETTLTENWNGSAWTIVSSPNPGTDNSLAGVACGSASQCWAVGLTFPPSEGGSLTEKWNGSKWTVVHTPSSASGQLIGDTCVGTSPCLAVGLNDSLFAIAQQWNGTSWVSIAPKKPSGATDSQLNGVACTSATACESVGSYFNGTDTLGLAEGWNGTKWALQTTPAISGASYVSLQAVACPAASDCLAAGESIAGSTTSPLLESWNGTAWSVS